MSSIVYNPSHSQTTPFGVSNTGGTAYQPADQMATFQIVTTVPLTITATIPIVVVIDGAPAGSTPLTAQLTPGIHTVIVPGNAPDASGNPFKFLAWNDGSTSASRTIDVEPPGVSLMATYVPNPPPPPPNYTWLIAVAVIGAAGIGVVAYSRRKHS